DLATVFQSEGVRQIGERIGFGWVVVGRIGRIALAARAGPEAFDAQLLHHVPVILLSGPIRRTGAGARGAGTRGRSGCTLPMQWGGGRDHEQAGCEKEGRAIPSGTKGVHEGEVRAPGMQREELIKKARPRAFVPA